MSVRNSERSGRAPDQGDLVRSEIADERRSGRLADADKATDAVIQSSQRMLLVAENGALRIVFPEE